MDERIRRLVMSQPIPVRLVNAIANAPDLEPNLNADRLIRARDHRVASLDPADLTPVMRRHLELVCHGWTDNEIAAEMHYSHYTCKDRSKALLGIFRARNRAHLAALAVSQGHVELDVAA